MCMTKIKVSSLCKFLQSAHQLRPYKTDWTSLQQSKKLNQWKQSSAQKNKKWANNWNWTKTEHNNNSRLMALFPGQPG